MNTTNLPRVASYQGDYQAIIGVLNDYFDGLYHGDVEKLRSIFHEDTVLKGSEYRRTRDEWLEAVGELVLRALLNFSLVFHLQEGGKKHHLNKVNLEF